MEQKILFDSDQIKEAVKAVAEKLNEKFQNSSQPPILISVLHGSIYFAADLSRELSFPHLLEAIEAKSYDGEKKGKLLIVKEPYLEIDGRDIILVEDIIDSGHTVKHIKQLLLQKYEVKSVITAALLAKKKHLLQMAEGEYIIGLWLDNDSPFVYGFGLDRDGLERNVPYIYIDKQD